MKLNSRCSLFVRALLLGVLFATALAAKTQTLNASGASFPAPLYQRWFVQYHGGHPDIQINFQSIGSGAGIKQFRQGLTDFGGQRCRDDG